MSTRAFYTIAAASWDGETNACRGTVVEISRQGDVVYVLAPEDPSEPLEQLGALRLGARISELPAAVISHVTAVEDPLAPRVIFAGDDPQDYR